MACVNPFDVNATKQLQSKTGKNTNAVHASTNELTRAVGRFYSASIESVRSPSKPGRPASSLGRT